VPYFLRFFITRVGVSHTPGAVPENWKLETSMSGNNARAKMLLNPIFLMEQI